ncbi:MAG: hypothetical protein LBU07_04780 [Coriobacteriales bacterium]|jgi:hypothetical protein|nr:hypothetical protein [Coriobacteriales bacterium]
MLDHCRHNVKEAALTNVDCGLVDWFNCESIKALGTFDVVIACRTAALSDFERLDALA